MVPVLRNGLWPLCASVIGCGDLAQPPDVATSARSTVTAAVEPPRIGMRVAPVVHFRLSGLGCSAQPPPTLIEGHASDRNVRDLASGAMSNALAERVIATTVWCEQDGVWVVVPASALTLGETYSVVAPSAQWSEVFDVVDRDDVPWLSRTWPPAGEPGTYAVWCENWPVSAGVASGSVALSLLPDAPGTASLGVFEGIGAGCLRWQPDEVREGSVVPPPMIALGDATYRMDPSPLELNGETPPASPSCTQGEAAGPVCVDVLDDRAVFFAQDAWLIGLEVSQGRWANRVGPGQPWVVRPLPASSEIQGVVRAVSVSGTVERHEISWRTLSSSAHVVINEVMANPAGPEPNQEWVELYNDGTLDVALGGWQLQDAGGSAELPEAVLRAGAYALVVGPGYAMDSWVDRAPEPGTLILRVESLGKSGLSNGGEPVRLVGPDGSTASMIPAIPSKEQGWSIVRITPEALDSLSSSFGFGTEGGTPGGSNETWEPID